MELWVWVCGAAVVWFSESFMIYLRVRLAVVEKQYFIGHPALETYLRALPAHTLAQSLIIDICAGLVFAIAAALLLRVFARVLKWRPDALAFHGAACAGAILFLYGAVLLNTRFFPTVFDRASVFYTSAWGFLCILSALLCYFQFKRVSVSGVGRLAPGALIFMLCAYLFPAQMLLDRWLSGGDALPPSWADPVNAAWRAGLFTATASLYLTLAAIARRWRIGAGKIGLAVNWAGLAMAVFLAIFAVTAWGGGRFSSRDLNVSKASPSSPNVLMITMDTVRADGLSCYNPKLRTTPFVDSVAAEGVLFEQARSTAPWTLPGHASIFTGKYPSIHGATWEYTYLGNEHVTMAEIFRAAGYDTAGFSSNIWVDPFTNMDRGFRVFWRGHPRKALPAKYRGKQLWENIWPPLSTFLGITKWSPPPATGKLRQSERINRRVRTWLNRERKKDRPFFLFVNYIDAHNTYRPPKRFKPRIPPRTRINKIYRLNKSPYKYIAGEQELTPKELAVLKSLYHGEIRFEDHIINQLRRLLDRQGLWKDTLVVITADHGEYLGERHLLDHLFGVGEPVLHVPLIIRAPGRVPAGLRVDTPVQTVDILPTILELTGIKYKAADIEGHSMVGIIKGSKKFRKYSIGELMVPILPLKALKARTESGDAKQFETRRHTITEGPYQYEMNARGDGALWLLRGTEMEDVTAAEPGRARKMRTTLLKWLADHPMTNFKSGEGPVITPEIMKEIKALGYVE